MDWRLFGSTFLLVFLAELGDKTQLTALAASAGSKSPWSVFLGASLALVIATLVAVLAGSVLTKYVPERVLKIGAAILFLVFGTILLITNIRPKQEPALPSRIELHGGILTTLVLETARNFEAAAADDYEKLIASTNDANVKALFASLAQQESQHMKDVEDMIQAFKEGRMVESVIEEKEHYISCPVGIRDFNQAGSTTLELLDQAIAHEKIERDFFATMSRAIHIPGLKPIFQRLAQEEDNHLRDLLAMKESCSKDTV